MNNISCDKKGIVLILKYIKEKLYYNFSLANKTGKKIIYGKKI